jgi:hypothetical protein
MRQKTRLSLVFAALLLLGSALQAQITPGPDRNTSQKTGDDAECAITKNPSNNLQLFASCNVTVGGGLFAARSTNGGLTWTYPDPADKTLADGDPGQGPAACCDPTLTWDTFGNLFFAYLDAAVANVVVLLSTNGGASFTTLATFPGSVDQPTIVAANTTAPGAPVAVWVVWNQSGQMRARGAAVTGLGTVGAFGPLQTIPGTSGCSFGDVAISPAGAVVQVCQTPTGGQGPGTLLVNTDSDGLGINNFAAAVTATTTNVGGFDFIPAQNTRSVDAEAGLAYDANSASPHFGRLYLVYTEETVNENNNLNVMVRFSDNNGATWSAPIQVNDDLTARSQFMPKIASNRLSGNVAVCWHDARNSVTNTAMQIFCSMATPTGPSPVFFANGLVSDGASTSNGASTPSTEFGDYAGMAYHQGIVHPIWGDTSNSTGNNPQGTSNFDAYTDRVWGGAAANEGDPHITTVDGVHYDFQSAGEFTALRDASGFEIQTRQTAIPTTWLPGPNPHTGLSNCVALNTAVAARVGKHRVTFQPNISGVPDPSGMQTRIDGVLTTIPPGGIPLDGGLLLNSAGGGIEIEFPNSTYLIVTPGWWASQQKWYLNVNVTRTPALEGIMGAIPPGNWLPMLPDGTLLGPRPAALHDRYVQLYEKFEEAWRVTDETSLFDYAPGTSTKTFTIESWPSEDGLPCELPEVKPVEPLDEKTAIEACQNIRGRFRRDDCIFDVMALGDTVFAKTYEITEKLLDEGTVTELASMEQGTFTAIVSKKAPHSRRDVPAGSVQFVVDGNAAGKPVKLESRRAVWKAPRLTPGTHRVSARFIPARGSAFLASSSSEKTHDVKSESGR